MAADSETVVPMVKDWLVASGLALFDMFVMLYSSVFFFLRTPKTFSLHT